MLDLHKAAQALDAKRDLFRGYDQAQGTALEGYRCELAAAARLSRAEVQAQLQGIAWPGARPTGEHDRFHAPVVPFAREWTNHEQARDWARGVLEGVLTIAVDGSQIAPAPEYGLPVGAVQIGWFENPHRADGDYVKDVSFEVLAPQELATAGEEEALFPDREVNRRRFLGECQRLIACMRKHRRRQPHPLCLLDGSLILSFTAHMRPEEQAGYVQAVAELLATSQECQVPLVGYIDASYASDLVAMLDSLAGRSGGPRPADAAILRPLMRWGDRTPAWACARQDAVVSPAGKKYYDQVGFVYLKTTAANPPARLDFPLWILEEGLLDQVVDLVRAECVVGNGYPYAAETADAVAVITMQDRERFLALFQRFASQEGLPLRFSRKAGSKLGRR